ncbi:hemin uptake protein HemP [Amorphus sp. MBR-141]
MPDRRASESGGEGETPTAGSTPPTGRGRPPRWQVEEICGEGGEALIELDGDLYRLRITARRRLILTK